MLTGSQKTKIKNGVNKILHNPANRPSGNILEMTLVLDFAVDRETLSQIAKETFSHLRKSGDPFLNIRLTLLLWKSNTLMERRFSSFAEIAMGRIEGEKEYALQPGEEEKNWDALSAELLVNHARSKLVLLITEKTYYAVDIEKVSGAMKPVLSKRILEICTDGRINYPFMVAGRPEAVKDEASLDSAGNENTALEGTVEANANAEAVDEVDRNQITIEEYLGLDGE